MPFNSAYTMTVQSYIQQMDKMRGIANQDISMFEYTPVRDVFRMRKEAAIKLENARFDQRETLVGIVERCEVTIKNYLLL